MPLVIPGEDEGREAGIALQDEHRALGLPCLGTLLVLSWFFLSQLNLEMVREHFQPQPSHL